MIVSEVELRRLIRKQINESKWHQFKGNLKNLAKSTGISSGKLGDDKNFRDYIEFVFSQESYVSKLYEAKMNFMGLDGHRNPDELLKELNQISVEALPVYLGFAVQRIERAPWARQRFVKLIQTSSIQLASSTRHYEEGGIRQALDNIKPDLEEDFNTLSEIVLRGVF